jgi:hypothetical protein
MSAMGGSDIAKYVIMDLVLGILLVWTYAAIRPRFGPGAKTALYVGIVFWIFGLITTYGYLHIGMMTTGTWISYGLLWLVNLILGTIAGAMVYSEDAAAG